MRVVDRKTFLAMPPGTVFNKWNPCTFGDLCIKGATMGKDFSVQYLDSLQERDGEECIDALYRLEVGEAIPVDLDCQSRDGLFDDDQLFAVWDDADVAALIARLSACRAT